MTVPIFMPCIVLCVAATVITFVLGKVNPLAGLHNMPKAIQERVHSLPEYRYQAPPMLTTAQRLKKKLPAQYPRGGSRCGGDWRALAALSDRLLGGRHASARC